MKTNGTARPAKWVLTSKIQKAIVTGADVNYVGSITIDEDLMERVDLWPGQRVLVVSNTSGARLETYVITGTRGGGDILMNGAAAHLIKEGEELIIMGFSLSEEPLQPRNILVDRKNRFVRNVHERERERLEAVPEMMLSCTA
jgi:aspartate 1-decarboxylase